MVIDYGQLLELKLKLKPILAALLGHERMTTGARCEPMT